MKVRITLPPSDPPVQGFASHWQYALAYEQALDFLANMEQLVQAKTVESYLASLDQTESPEVQVKAWKQASTKSLVWLDFVTDGREDDLLKAIRSAARTCGGWYEVLPSSEAIAIAFIEHVDQDPILLDRIRQLRRGDVSELIEIAHDAGYEFDDEGLLRACITLQWGVGGVWHIVACWRTFGR